MQRCGYIKQVNLGDYNSKWFECKICVEEGQEINWIDAQVHIAEDFECILSLEFVSKTMETNQ